MQEKSILYQHNARYFQLGRLDETTEQLVFVIHGYGQLANFFLKKFEKLNDGKICIIAPEGQSRFYLQGFSGRVGATWMTKEDRLRDIENYIQYLNAIYNQITHHISPNVKISILGFSQGSATASRWAAQADFNFEKLVLYAGIFPPDMDMSHAAKVFSKKQIIYVYGNQDKFITPERLIEMKQLSRALDLNPTVLTFDGEHEINAEILGQIFL